MGRGVAAVAVVAVALVVASPLQAAGPTRVACRTGKLTFLFWPQGHAAVASAGFPSFPYPHMEVYKTAGGRYPNPNEVALLEFQANGTTAAGFAKSCTAASGTVSPAVPAAKVTATSGVVCTLPANAQLDYVKTPSSITIRALVPSGASARVGLPAHFARGGTVLNYDPVFCRASAPPR